MSRGGKLAPEVNRALFVKNLSYNVTSEELFDLFGKFGPVRYANYVYKHVYTESKYIMPPLTQRAPPKARLLIILQADSTRDSKQYQGDRFRCVRRRDGRQASV
ncbi:MAG: hypothetical protein M1826_000480 [Phylliscum demangeonii]|nr:MAG: hypothetical protein M1826_000480 [Phylliscum demangeonii]